MIEHKIKDEKEVVTGYFIFTNIDTDKNTLEGKWYKPDGKGESKVILTKTK